MNRVYLPHPGQPSKPLPWKRRGMKVMTLLHHLLWWPVGMTLLLAALLIMLTALTTVVLAGLLVEAAQRSAPVSIGNRMIDLLADREDEPPL